MTICTRCGAEDTQRYEAEADFYYCSELCGSDEFDEVEDE